MSLFEFGRQLGRFARNRDGNVALILGLSSLPLILMVGASVDYTRAVTKKTSLQQATDATSLAVAHYLTQNLSSAQLLLNTTNYFSAAVGDTTATIVTGPTVSPDNTQVCLTTKDIVPTTIMRAAAAGGFTTTTQVTVGAQSCAKINNTTYEIALALDNSGSMLESTSGTTKIASLQTAATQLVSIMNPSGSVPKASISIVPFSLAVNVGSQYRGASWIDNNGQSSIAMQNFSLPKNLAATAFAPTNKFTLFDAMGQSWGGCVEERPGALLASDTPATTGDSLFVPYLNPDEYSDSNNTSLISYYGFSYINNYLATNSIGNGSGTAGGSCQSNDLYAQADVPNNSIAKLIDAHASNPDLPYTAPISPPPKSPVGDTQTMVCKYNKPTLTLESNFVKQLTYGGQNSGFSTGPNLLCDSRPITTLTNNNSTLTSQINALYAKGSTNLFSGVMWGWRTISPNGPFNTQVTPASGIGPQNAQSYTATNNVKVIILMTDGYNSWNALDSNYSDRVSTYSPFGYFDNSRLGTTNSSNWRSVMDTATLQACTNAKNAGIQIYTVGFSIPSAPIDSAGISLLQSCATTSSMAYIAQDGSTLVTTFQNIANQLSALRLVN